MASGKRVYYSITRGVFGFTDREGGGPRLVRDAPLIAARLKTHPQVRETVVLAFPDRRAGTGLYAFVEATPGVAEQSLREFIADSPGAKPPEHLQVMNQLPRRASGEVRSEILQLVAMNQLDQIDALVTDDRERALIASIVADRRNCGTGSRSKLASVFRSTLSGAQRRATPTQRLNMRSVLCAPCARAGPRYSLRTRGHAAGEGYLMNSDLRSAALPTLVLAQIIMMAPVP